MSYVFFLHGLLLFKYNFNCVFLQQIPENFLFNQILIERLDCFISSRGRDHFQ